MKNIILVQHCQSEHHINNMSGGWTNSILTPFGKEQAKKVGVSLREIIQKNDEYALYSSDLLRASQTSDIIGKLLKLDVKLDIGLREINIGIAIGKTKEWAETHRNPLKSNQFNLSHREFDDGESWTEFYYRVSGTMDRIIIKEKKENFIIVTHGGTLAYIMAWFLQFEPDKLNSVYFLSEPGGITVLGKNRFNQNSLFKFNDTSHL